MKKLFFIFTMMFLLFINTIFAQANDITTNDYEYAWPVQYPASFMSRYYDLSVEGTKKFKGDYIQTNKRTDLIPVVAPYDGTVLISVFSCNHKGQMCSCNQLMGNAVVILQSDGRYVYLEHLYNKKVVSSGDTVKKGDIIGYAGNSGYTNATIYQVYVLVYSLDEDTNEKTYYEPYLLFGDQYRCLEHSFTNYTDNGDGTESAKCDNCYIVATREKIVAEATTTEIQTDTTTNKLEVVTTKENEENCETVENIEEIQIVENSTDETTIVVAKKDTTNITLQDKVNDSVVMEENIKSEEKLLSIVIISTFVIAVSIRAIILRKI